MFDQTAYVINEVWRRMVAAVSSFMSGQEGLHLVLAIIVLLIFISIVLTYLMRKLKR